MNDLTAFAPGIWEIRSLHFEQSASEKNNDQEVKGQNLSAISYGPALQQCFFTALTSL